MNYKIGSISMVLCCIFLSGQCQDTHTAKRIITKQSSDFDSIINRYRTNNFSGSVLLVIDGKEVISTGMGKTCPGSNKEIDPGTTVFEVGSTSKQFTTAAVLMLEEAGRLKTSDNLEKFFPNVPGDKKNITISQLMSNSSGLDTYHDKKGAFEEISKEEALKRIWKQKLRFKPGEKYSYSNSGFTLLAMIIETVTGSPFRKFMRDSVFVKAGLTQTGFMGEKIWDKNVVACGTGFSRKGHPYDWPEMSWAELGAGNMVSSISDYQKWLTALLNGKVISPAGLKKLFGEYIKYTDINDEAYYSYGWIILNHPSFGKIIYHNGGEQFGFISTVRIYDQPNSFLIILCNNFDHQPHELFQLRRDMETMIFK